MSSEYSCKDLAIKALQSEYPTQGYRILPLILQVSVITYSTVKLINGKMLQV